MLIFLQIIENKIVLGNGGKKFPRNIDLQIIKLLGLIGWIFIAIRSFPPFSAACICDSCLKSSHPFSSFEQFDENGESVDDVYDLETYERRFSSDVTAKRHVQPSFSGSNQVLILSQLNSISFKKAWPFE